MSQSRIDELNEILEVAEDGLQNAQTEEERIHWEGQIQEVEAELDELFGADEYDGQPTEYEEWQDYMGGDDWDHGQYDC